MEQTPLSDVQYSDSLALLRGQRILVTGAGGFIGSHLCRRLCSAGVEVHAISRAEQLSAHKNQRWWQGDLADAMTTRELLTSIQPEVIFHLASHVKGARGLENVIPTLRSNLISTVNILTVASETRCRRIVLSNSLEEPDRDDPQPIPSSPYAAAKWASSSYARMFHALYQLPIVILRVFMVYGPAQRDLTKLIPYVTLSLLRGETPSLSSGQRQVDWIYVEDVVDALVSAACATGVDGRTLDVGSGELVSIRTVVEQLARFINPEIKPLFGALADRPLEQVRVAETADTFAQMGWKPRTSLMEGLERTVGWYRQQLQEKIFKRS